MSGGSVTAGVTPGRLARGVSPMRCVADAARPACRRVRPTLSARALPACVGASHDTHAPPCTRRRSLETRVLFVPARREERARIVECETPPAAQVPAAQVPGREGTCVDEPSGMSRMSATSPTRRSATRTIFAVCAPSLAVEVILLDLSIWL